MIHFMYSKRFLVSLAALVLGVMLLAPQFVAAQAPQIGPMLYLVQANALQVRRLPATGLTVHTALLSSSSLYIASGDVAAATAASATGATVRVLDANTQGK